ncbi:hypothetical protein BH23VER1_BH23VER1_04700 [soil metagenome]
MMKTLPHPLPTLIALATLWMLGGLAAQAQDGGADEGAEGGEAPGVPEDLIDDDHVREEFGVNQFTAPSIAKLFDLLDVFGKLPYEQVKREVPSGTPRDRMVIALSMGTLIGEGFLVVDAERIEDLEPVGRAILKHAKVLGAGMRVTGHAKSLLENSARGDYQQLRGELAATQRDVEAEMVLLRDVEAAHLIALGGWLRAFEIAATAAATPYTPERTRALKRGDIAEYFLYSLDSLHPDLQEKGYIQNLKSGLTEVTEIVGSNPDEPLTEEALAALQAKARELVNVIVAQREE